MKIIKSLQNQNIKDIAKLKEKKYRDMTGLFLIEGEHLVRMAIESGNLETILVDENAIEKYLDFIDEENTIIVNEAIVNKLSYTKSPQGIVGVVRKKEIYVQGLSKVLILDNLQDPGNVGTLLRSALAFNYNQVFISNESVDIYNDKVIRASQGAIFKLNIKRDSLSNIYSLLKDEKFKIYATGLTNNSLYLEDLKPSKKCALVLGNEGNGISEETKNEADEIVKINMSSKIDSLNVSVAGSIAMYYIKGENKL